MSRLDFAPDTSAMGVTDISTGHFVFSPLPEKPVSYSNLDKAITGAGYEIEEAALEVTGKFMTNAHLRVEETGQTFHLIGEEELGRLREEVRPGARVTVSGLWNTERGAETVVVKQWSAGSS